MNLKYISIFFVTALALAGCGSSAGEEPEPPVTPDVPKEKPSDTVLADCKLVSKVLGGRQLYTVYVPEGWDDSKTYPVLYILHGAEGGNNDWFDGGKIHEQVREYGADIVVVSPNCTVDGKNLFYCNGYQGTAQYMTYFFNEFLPEVEKEYNIGGSRDRRMVAGLSMGGYGSLYYGALHPEMFCCVYACSPATSIDGTPNILNLWYSDAQQGAKLPDTTIEIGSEDFLIASARTFHNFLTEKNIAHNYIERPGSHDWPFWQACAPKIVKKATEVLSKP